jgi:hypothetical protein
MNENVFAAFIPHDETETLLRIEEFYNAGAFANDLRGHATAATAAAETTATAAAAAETTAAAATAEAIATTKATAITAAKATTVTKATTRRAVAAAEIRTATERIFAKSVPLVLAAPTAPSVKTHALLITFARPETTHHPVPDEGQQGLSRFAIYRHIDDL